MTKLQSSEIASAIDKIIEGLGMLKGAVSCMVPAAPRRAEPVRPEPALPPNGAAGRQTRLGHDAGYEDRVNPNRQTAGQAGGLATAGVKRAPCPDRRPRGSVMVKDMSVNEKRCYWRWSKDRALARKNGAEPQSWDEWRAARG